MRGLKNYILPRLPAAGQGFTLIEIIVGVGLLLLLNGLFIANYNGFSNSQTVKQTAADLVTNLQAVRTSASAAVTPTGCDTLVGYRVSFPTASTYSASALCQVDGSEQPVGSATTYALPASVTFSPTPQTFTFYALNRGASVNQTINITGGGVTVKVSVLTSGVVSNFVETPTP